MTGCLVALAVLGATGVVALVLRGRAASLLGALGAVAAAVLALPPAIASLAGAPSVEVAVPWAAPIGAVHLGLDPLSAVFAVPLLALGAVCACYGAAYLDELRGRRALGPPAGLFNLLVGSMLLVLLARDAIVLLVAWEAMTLASFGLVVFDHAQPDVRHAGWVYLVASHLGVACLIAFALLAGDRAGDFAFTAIAAHPLAGGAAATAAVLALVGFGVKAGVVPLHVWLPDAHAAAPAHVSAVMSGVMIKLGLYAILRTAVLLPGALPWGPLLVALGVIGAAVAIALASYQRDLKRALAYSSVENMGIALVGVGVGLWGVAAHRPAIAALGLCGGLLHVWTHAAMKGMLFLGAGGLAHGAGTRDLERLGGLLRRMPRTGALFVLGAAAIAGLPPLAGFASEWLMYLGLAHGGVEAGPTAGLMMLFAVAALATVGVVAALAFVRLVGIALLGEPRSAAAAGAHEAGAGLVAPIAVLGALVVAAPFALPALVGLLAPVLAELAGGPVPVAPAAHALGTVATLAAVLWAALAATFVALTRLSRAPRSDTTWGCGYTAPSPRMQYTGASFAEALHRLLPRAMRARVAVPEASELFPAPGRLAADRRDPFTRSAYEPLIDRLARRFGQLRWVQQGQLHLYLLYVVLAVVGGVAAVSAYDFWRLP